MATTTEAEYLEAKRAHIEDLENDATDTVFGRVWIAPFFDENDMPKIPRFPCAVVSMLDSEISEFNGSIMNGHIGVTVVHMTQRDPIGHYGTLELLKLGHDLTRSIKIDRDDDIKFIGAAAPGAAKTQLGQQLFYRQYVFRFTIELDEAP